MDNENQPAIQPEKVSFQDALQAAAGKLADQLKDTENYNEVFGLIYSVLREETLKSWKNGIEAGKRKAARPGVTKDKAAPRERRNWRRK